MLTGRAAQIQERADGHAPGFQILHLQGCRQLPIAGGCVLAGRDGTVDEAHEELLVHSQLAHALRLGSRINEAAPKHAYFNHLSRFQDVHGPRPFNFPPDGSTLHQGEGMYHKSLDSVVQDNIRSH